jgi:small subunit ribosomal protein S19
MARSSKKLPFVEEYVLRKVRKVSLSGKKQVINIMSRRSVILPDFVGFTFGVHNGKIYIPVSVSEEMVGYKFGEFSPTRTYYGHGADKKVRKKK